jgi:hypothetical protein
MSPYEYTYFAPDPSRTIHRRFDLSGTIYHTPRGWQDEDIRLSLDLWRREGNY